MAIFGKIQEANNPEVLKEIVFTWLRRNAAEIGVHVELTYEKAVELANKVGYRNSAAAVLQAAIAKSHQFPSEPSRSEKETPEG